MTTRRTLLGALAGSALSPVGVGPHWARAADSKTSLRTALSQLDSWVSSKGGRLSAAIVALPSNQMLAQAGADTPLNPASNMKLLTAAVALSQLGPQFRYSTGLYGKLQGGRIDPLVLRGHGDPSLSTRDLWRLAGALARSGLKEVGTILVDQSRFDEQFVPPAFEQQPDEWATFRAPVSAIALDENTVTLHVVPTEIGKPATLWFEPPGFVRVEGTVQTGAPGSGQRATLKYTSEHGKLVAHVGGTVARGLPRLRFQKRVDDPRLLPGFTLRHLFQREGVQVDGPVHLGGGDVKRRLVFQQSAPLTSLLNRLGKNSDNFYAEMLLKTLGAEKAQPATSRAGAQLIESWLKQNQAWAPEFRVENGSGLFNANRISANAIVRVLQAVYETPSLYPEFLAQLAVAGTDGTLRSRLRDLRAGRRVRAKTGTLARVGALSGYVLGPNNDAVAFSILVNGIAGQHAAVRSHIDDVVRAIAAA